MATFQPVTQEQASILDLFFPGFTRISTVVQQYTAIDLDTIIPMLCICSWLGFVCIHVGRYMWNWVETYFISTIHVSYSDEAYHMLLAWVSSQSFARHSCTSLASVDLSTPWPRRVSGDVHQGGSGKKPLHYAPWNGCFYFWYRSHLLAFRRMEKLGEPRFFREEEVSISCLGRSSKVLKDLLDECRHHYLGLARNKTPVFEHQNERWKPSKAREARLISTVILDEKEKETVLSDIRSFLDPTTREWYAERGIPYRRGYLWYGPPGTGKSSLSLSIAGCFDLDIYILNLSSIDDSALKTLFSELPQQCVILLEDIDAACQNRSKDTQTAASGQATAGRFPKLGVTLSGLLNALDGVASQEGRVLIMTTNHIDRLDDALIRPGRVDRKVEFRQADKDTVAGLFRIVFKQSDGDETVERLASDFATKVPEMEFSPAEILSLLLEHRQSPINAMANVDEWVAKTREEKSLRRENSWVHNA